MNLSPVLITVYNRPDHFKKCVESLKKNNLSLKTDLFIAIDRAEDKKNIGLNNQVIEYARGISGFNSVILFIRESNIGSVNNFFKAIKDIFNKYETIIISEDDNIFSENFLSFVNEGLEFYENNDKVFSICAYNYPINTSSIASSENFYYSKLFSGWGFGVWKKKWEKIDWNREAVLNETRNFLKNYKNVYEYNKTANNLVLNLIYMIKNNTIYGDSFISLYQYLNNCYSIFPAVSMVRNIGHDNSGEHCKKRKNNEIFANQELYSGNGNYFFSTEIKENDGINSLLKKYFKRNFIKNIYTFIVLFLFNIGILYKKN